MCDSVQCELSEGNSCCSVPFPISEGTSLFPLCCSHLPQLALEGRAGEECGLFSPKVRHVKLSWFQPQESAWKFAASEEHPQCFYFCQISEVWFWLLLLQLPDGPMAQSFDFTQPITVPSHALVHCGFAVFIPVPFPETGRGSFPNHHEDDFGDEWSCVNCRKHTRVSSTAIRVFSKASFCCSGILAGLAQLVACLVNFLVQLLKVFSLLRHWWCY